MTDSTNQNDVLADRVALMRGKVKEDQAKNTNWPMIGVIAGCVIFFGGFAIVTLGGAGVASTPTITPEAAVTDDAPETSPSALFGDTSPIVFEPEGPNEEVLQLRSEIESLRAMLNKKNTEPDVMPEAFIDELQKMRNDMQAMQSLYESKTDSYERYINELEAKFAAESRLPRRPVTLQDSKWERAQQLNAVDNNGEAARIAAPQMVFDGSRQSSEEAKDDELDTQLIIEQFGTAFPTSEELTPAPQ